MITMQWVKMSPEDIKEIAAKYSFVPQLYERGDNANFAVGVITCACATVAGAIRLCTCSIRARNTCSLLLLPLLFPSKNIPTLDEYQYFFLPSSIPFPSLPSPYPRCEEALMVLLWDPNCTPSDHRGDPFGYASNAYNTKVYLLSSGFQRNHV